MEVLDEMMPQRASQCHQVQGPLAIAGRLTREHIKGTFNRGTGKIEHKDNEMATVWCSDSATIQSGAWIVRTHDGCHAHGREHTDQYVYVPFRSARGHNHCVMHIKQILLIRRKKMDWVNDEARVAVGTLWEHLPVRRGAGLETEYNDDPSTGACSVPRAMHLSPKQKGKGRSYCIFLRQIHCPCVFVPDKIFGDTFMTLSKMGYHGRRDLQVTGVMEVYDVLEETS